MESYTSHCKSTNGKPTKWEETLSEALRESNQVIEVVGSKVDQLRNENVGSQIKTPPSFTTSISQIR